METRFHPFSTAAHWPPQNAAPVVRVQKERQSRSATGRGNLPAVTSISAISASLLDGEVAIILSIRSYMPIVGEGAAAGLLFENWSPFHDFEWPVGSEKQRNGECFPCCVCKLHLQWWDREAVLDSVSCSFSESKSILGQMGGNTSWEAWLWLPRDGGNKKNSQEHAF